MNPPHPVDDDASVVPGLVLDTNVVLDWLVFGNPTTRAFASAIKSASVHWRVTPALRDELAHVLGRGLRSAPGLDTDTVWHAWETLSVYTPEPAPVHTGPTTRFCCTDPDDQKFIDLAVACGARWLLSRDKAVLKLARHVRPLGLLIITPLRWS